MTTFYNSGLQSYAPTTLQEPAAEHDYYD